MIPQTHVFVIYIRNRRQFKQNMGFFFVLQRANIPLYRSLACSDFMQHTELGLLKVSNIYKSLETQRFNGWHLTLNQWCKERGSFSRPYEIWAETPLSHSLLIVAHLRMIRSMVSNRPLWGPGTSVMNRNFLLIPLDATAWSCNWETDPNY